MYCNTEHHQLHYFIPKWTDFEYGTEHQRGRKHCSWIILPSSFNFFYLVLIFYSHMETPVLCLVKIFHQPTIFYGVVCISYQQWNYKSEAYWVPPNPLTFGGWTFHPWMLGGRFVRPLHELLGGWVFFPILMGLPMSWRVHCTTSDMKRHLPWFTGRRRSVLLINIVLLLARVY